MVYDLVRQFEEWVQSIRKEVIAGDLEVLAAFGKKEGRRHIIGGRVGAGEMRVGAACDIRRGTASIGTGRIINLQKQKQDVARVEVENECGLLVETEADIRIGDRLVVK